MAPRLDARVNAVNEDLVGLMASTAGADGRLEVVGADRAGGRHEIRSFFASGPPGLNYSQKTNLNRTSGDLLGLG